MSLNSFSEWCTPETILVLARATDQPARVLAAIRNSGAGSARVLLAQLTSTPAQGSMTATFRPRHVLSWPTSRESASSPIPIDRAVSWSDVASQSFFISSVSLSDLPTLVKAFKVGRIVLTAGRGAERGGAASIEETLLESLDVPIWIVGPNVQARVDATSHMHRVLLPITFASSLERSLQFACEYTRVRHGTLTLLHIFDTWARGCAPEDRTPVAVKSRLPLTPLFQSRPPCALEVAVRQGAFDQELLHFNEQRPQDVILMDGFPPGSEFRQVLFHAACPVLLFRAAKPIFAGRAQYFEPALAEVPNRKAM